VETNTDLSGWGRTRPATWLIASAAQVFSRPRVYMTVDRRSPEHEEHADAVRCVECAAEYRLAAGAEAACPSCGCPTWVSARIPGGAALRPSLGSA
jgi:hypothetical protein